MKWLFRTGSIIIIFVSIIHMTWAFALMINDKQPTGIALILSVFGGINSLAAALLMIAAMMAQLTVICTFGNFKVTIWFLMPQQFFLFLSAIGVIMCVYRGQFFTGEVYPPEFIFASQSWLIYLSIFHAIAIVLNRVVSENIKEVYLI